MKRLIVISVVFALIAAGTAFAEISLGGTVFGKIDVVGGSSVENSDITAGGGMGRVDVSANAENDDGTFGGFLRFRSGGWGAGTSGWGAAWWKPIDQVKFQIGNNPDGIFDTSHMTRWGFYQIAGDVGVVNAGNAWGGGPGAYVLTTKEDDIKALLEGKEPGTLCSDYVFFGGFGGFGAMLSITPVDLLSFNFVLPYSGGPAEDTYKKLIAQAVVNLDGIGQINLTYQADKGYKDAKGTAPGAGTPGTTWYLVSLGGTAAPTWINTKPGDNDVVLDTYEGKGTPGTPASADYKAGYDVSPGKIFASFYFSGVEDLGIDLGLSYTLPSKAEKDADMSSPLGLGLGVQYGSGAFGIKARVLAALGGKLDKDTTIPIGLTFDILPSYAVSDDLTIFFSAGLGLNAIDEDADTDVSQAKVNFHINPYVQYKFDWSKGLFAGFLLQSKGFHEKKDANGDTKDSVLTWSVPVGLYFTF